MATVLLVDDEKSIRTTLKMFLQDAGHTVCEAASVQEANAWADRCPLDVALLDILLPNGTGLDVASTMRDRQPAARVILITGEPSFASASLAIRLHIFDYLVKPVGKQQVLDIVGCAATAKAQEEDYALLLVERERFGEEMERQVKVRTAELSQSTADLHALAARLQLVREEERTALARELHDEFGQNLTALQFDVNWIDRQLQAAKPIDVAALQNRVSAMGPLAKRLTEMTQNVCASLRPGMLDDLGLAAAIEWQAEECQKRTGLTCTVALPDDDIVIVPDLALALFRIFQESLTNVVRHAQATRVEIKLHVDAGELHLEVRDDGRGFAPQLVKGSRALGFLSMRERSAGFGGSVVILSEPGKGTTVRVRMPYNQETL
ncbi:MAG: response regulator [Verrucomicrobia bacterium]|jgi:signal transduction histidine kinase|nr:response regulator [Verrucomicrobiota bacterium]MBT7701370.1 response regulator [Verrucomicrobiota bacterium]